MISSVKIENSWECHVYNTRLDVLHKNTVPLLWHVNSSCLSDLAGKRKQKELHFSITCASLDTFGFIHYLEII